MYLLRAGVRNARGGLARLGIPALKRVEGGGVLRSQRAAAPAGPHAHRWHRNCPTIPHPSGSTRGSNWQNRCGPPLSRPVAHMAGAQHARSGAGPSPWRADRPQRAPCTPRPPELARPRSTESEFTSRYLAHGLALPLRPAPTSGPAHSVRAAGLGSGAATAWQRGSQGVLPTHCSARTTHGARNLRGGGAPAGPIGRAPSHGAWPARRRP